MTAVSSLKCDIKVVRINSGAVEGVLDLTLTGVLLGICIRLLRLAKKNDMTTSGTFRRPPSTTLKEN